MSGFLSQLRAEWSFFVLSLLVLVLLLGGLLLRVNPMIPEEIGIPLERSLIPLRYLDLVGIGVFLLFLYSGFKRREVSRLKTEVSTRASNERTISMELAELSSIFQVSSRVNSFRDVEEALQFIADTARDCLNADRSSLFLMDDNDLVMRAASGRQVDLVQGARMKVGEGVTGWVALHRRPLLLNSKEDLQAFYPDGHLDRNIVSALCVPLLLKGETLGVLNVNRLTPDGKEQYAERHLKLLSIFGDYAASTINNLRMYRQISTAHARMEKAFQELRGVQGQLIHAEKMSAIGQLISEVSHELNNPLTTAVGYAQLLTKVNRDPQIAEYLGVIREEGLRCQRIIQNLLDFARKNRDEQGAVGINQLIRKTVELRRYQLTISGVEVELDLFPRIPECVADGALLQQVIMNLLNNAEQAITNAAGADERVSGVIRFSTWHDVKTGRIEIEVADSGPGIPEGLENRVFEPFFTTKPSGKGTGLGLSVCRGILEDMGGEIRAGHAPEGGALFTVTLPVSESASDPQPEVPEEAAPVVRGKRILIVDDDPKVRALLTRTLELDEHEIDSVGSGAEALDRVSAAAFDLVLSDVRMPGMTGIQLYETLRERDDKVADRMVFFSGGVMEDTDLTFLQENGRILLQKPFRFEEVRLAIHEALAKREAADADLASTASE